MRNEIALPNFNGVAAGQTASTSLPCGGNLTYHKIVLAFYCTNAGNGNQANTESYVSQVRLKVNGTVQRTFTAKELDSINAFYHRPLQTNGTSAYLEIFLSEPWRRSPAEEDALAWGTADVGNFTIEADLAAGVTGPTLTPKAEVEYVSRPMGTIVKWKRYQQQVGAVGTVTLNTLPKKANEAYQALHCFPVAATDIIGVNIKTDGTERLQYDTYGDMVIDLTSGAFGASGGCNPQSTMFHVVFDRTGRVLDALPMQYVSANGQGSGKMVGDFRIDWNMNAPNTFNFTALVLGPRD